MDKRRQSPRRPRPKFADLFTPKLVTTLQEGYGLAQLRADALAGLTVAIVALPLSMAIAIASGAPPAAGLYTAIVGGALISLLGGSRFQIGGPAGAFIVLIAAIIEREGFAGLALATVIGGVLMIAVGFLQAGNFIKYIPYPVTVGFTAGIAIIIFASQLRELLGLEMASEPVELLPKLQAIVSAAPTYKPAAIAMALGSLALILILQRWFPRLPSLLIAVIAGALVTRFLNLGIDTLGTRFGGVPSGFPAFSLDFLWSIDWSTKIKPAIVNGLAIAFLGSLESLLSAVVADGMTGRRHRSNCELVAVGVGNIASVAFGGLCVTGTIARTATNIRAGAHGPLAGIFHAFYLLLFVMFAAPLVADVPLATLGAVLAIVAWNMAEKREFLSLLRSSQSDAVVVMTTFLLTIFVDLMVAIGVGVVIGAFVFLHHIAETIEVESGEHLVRDDETDAAEGDAGYGEAAVDRDVMVYRVSGAFFFGATTAVTTVFENIGTPPKSLILDLGEVPMIDSTAARSLHALIAKLKRQGTRVFIAGARRPIRVTLLAAGVSPRHVHYKDTVAAALEAARTAR